MTDARIFRVVDEDGDWYETVGDPGASLNAAYRERAHLVALLARHYPSHIGANDPSAPDWAVITLELPTGQACWHIAPADMDLFAHVQPTPHYARGWDGHTTEEKYRRIRELVAELHPEADTKADRPDPRRDFKAASDRFQQAMAAAAEKTTAAEAEATLNAAIEDYNRAVDAYNADAEQYNRAHGLAEDDDAAETLRYLVRNGNYATLETASDR